MKSLRFVGSLLILVGASLSGRALYLRGKAALASALIRLAWDETQRTGQRTRPWPWADTHPIGRLEIPALGYDEIILEGASLRNLAFGPARLMSGAALGEPGNLILAGHRNNWFLPLKDLRLGDTILVERLGPHQGVLRDTYHVDALRVIAPEDLSLLRPTAGDTLTLVTCYPFGPWPSSPQRFVVRASRAREAAPGRRAA
jgi:sortase A